MTEVRVLLVTDEPLLRLGLEAVIARIPGWMVCGVAPSPAPARELMAGVNPHAAVIDLNVGEREGLLLVKDFSRCHSHAPVLALASRKDGSDVERAFRAGAMGVVSRSDDADEVLRALDLIHRRRRYASPSSACRFFGSLAESGGPSASALRALSDREIQVFGMIGRGLGTTEIAGSLHVSVKTIETHRRRIMDKLGISGSDALRKQAIRLRAEEFRSGPVNVG